MVYYLIPLHVIPSSQHYGYLSWHSLSFAISLAFHFILPVSESFDSGSYCLMISIWQGHLPAFLIDLFAIIVLRYFMIFC
jgi:hypothetical protein